MVHLGMDLTVKILPEIENFNSVLCFQFKLSINYCSHGHTCSTSFVTCNPCSERENFIPLFN